MSDICLKPLAELSSLIAARALSPVELEQAYLARIDRLDGQLHSFNSLRAEAALEEAQAAEAAISAGDRIGPLHGIPIGIKDMIDVAGLPTTAQAVHLRDAMALRDADVVRALRAAGAIILGKQAMSEYAVGGTQTDHAWPPPCNPWDASRDALSSSSGPAVAVAAGLCAGSVGTETAGSIRAPAAWCGVAGLKPTLGRVGTGGVLALSETFDCVGPLAWTVEDCALLLAGMDGGGPFELPTDIKGLRVGVVRDWFEDDPNVSPEVMRATQDALRVLGDLGATCSDIRVGDFDALSATSKAISWREEWANHSAELRAYPERLTAVSRSRLLDGRAYTAAQYEAALVERRTIIAELAETMRDVDVLVLPTMKTPAMTRGFEFTDTFTFNPDLTRPFNLTTGPALAMCHGFADDGLPLSLQIIGRPGEDASVLGAGQALERALGLRSRRPAIATHRSG